MERAINEHTSRILLSTESDETATRTDSSSADTSQCRRARTSRPQQSFDARQQRRQQGVHALSSSSQGASTSNEARHLEVILLFSARLSKKDLCAMLKLEWLSTASSTTLSEDSTIENGAVANEHKRPIQGGEDFCQELRFLSRRLRVTAGPRDAGQNSRNTRSPQQWMAPGQTIMECHGSLNALVNTMQRAEERHAVFWNGMRSADNALHDSSGDLTDHLRTACVRPVDDVSDSDDGELCSLDTDTCWIEKQRQWLQKMEHFYKKQYRPHPQGTRPTPSTKASTVHSNAKEQMIQPECKIGGKKSTLRKGSQSAGPGRHPVRRGALRTDTGDLEVGQMQGIEVLKGRKRFRKVIQTKLLPRMPFASSVSDIPKATAKIPSRSSTTDIGGRGEQKSENLVQLQKNRSTEGNAFVQDQHLPESSWSTAEDISRFSPAELKSRNSTVADSARTDSIAVKQSELDDRRPHLPDEISSRLRSDLQTQKPKIPKTKSAKFLHPPRPDRTKRDAVRKNRAKGNQSHARTRARSKNRSAMKKNEPNASFLDLMFSDEESSKVPVHAQRQRMPQVTPRPDEKKGQHAEELAARGSKQRYSESATGPRKLASVFKLKIKREDSMDTNDLLRKNNSLKVSKIHNPFRTGVASDAIAKRWHKTRNALDSVLQRVQRDTTGSSNFVSLLRRVKPWSRDDMNRTL